MSEAKYTPGPWRSVELGSEGAVITPDVGDKREQLRWLAKVYGRDTLTDFANARLMAAAPEMYAALKEALDGDGCRCDTSVCNWCKTNGWVYVSPQAVLAIKAAIDKAEGRKS